MEKQRDFKVVNTPNTNTLSNTGKALPIVKSLIDIGLSEANITGEANIRKSARNPKGSGKKLKARDASYYPLHKIVKIENEVQIVLEPSSTLEIETFKDFIEATESEQAGDIVDILPPLYDKHFKIIADIKTRIMVEDLVTVNFKFRNILEQKQLEQKKPVKVKDVKFIKLNDMTVIVAYLENKDYYPINELDLYDTD